MLRSLFICFIVFLCGWVLMAVEILGGKILPIYFGSGIYVWGSVISVFLLALSLGYVAGGMLSQRVAKLWVLLTIIATAGVSIALLPTYYDELATFIQQRMEPPMGEQTADDPAAFEQSITQQAFAQQFGSLVASVLLFLPASVLLGMVSPYSIHLITRQVGNVGMRSGMLYAISTVGSFLGTLVTAFYLHAHMRTPNIFRLSGGLLVAVAVVGMVLSPLLRQPAAEAAAEAPTPDSE